MHTEAGRRGGGHAVGGQGLLAQRAYCILATRAAPALGAGDDEQVRQGPGGPAVLPGAQLLGARGLARSAELGPCVSSWCA